jgi:L-lactate dehydrogenase complex protein LldG
MGSREEILKRIGSNKPELIDLPVFQKEFFEEALDLMQEFTKKVEVVGGNVLEATSNQDIISQIQNLYPGTKVNYSNLQDTSEFNTFSLEDIKNPKELEDLDVLVLESDLAVAENGAVWLEDKKLPMRVLPFITKHLVLVLKKENIVSYMHEAYEKITQTEYGVFISGPSKTADIEQSLVIGAHGALSLSVFVL